MKIIIVYGYGNFGNILSEDFKSRCDLAFSLFSDRIAIWEK